MATDSHNARLTYQGKIGTCLLKAAKRLATVDVMIIVINLINTRKFGRLTLLLRFLSFLVPQCVQSISDVRINLRVNLIIILSPQASHFMNLFIAVPRCSPKPFRNKTMLLKNS